MVRDFSTRSSWNNGPFASERILVFKFWSVMFQSFGFGRWRVVWFWEQLEVKIVSAHASAA